VTAFRVVAGRRLAGIEAGLTREGKTSFGGSVFLVCNVCAAAGGDTRRFCCACARLLVHINKGCAHDPRSRWPRGRKNMAEFRFAPQQNRLTWINVSVYSLE
jgi:hypothetical protein